MQYKICEKNAIRVVGVKTSLTEEYEDNILKIPQFWKQNLKTKQFYQICKLAEQEPYGVLGISAYFDPRHIFYYIAAATNQPVPAELEEFQIPAATWCVVTGAPSATFADLFRGLFLEFLPSSGMDYAALPDIEAYSIDSKGMGSQVREAWFAVKLTGE